MEIWKVVKGYTGLYEVSNRGQVRSVDRVDTYTLRGTLCKRTRKGRLLKSCADKDGYERVHLWKDGSSRMRVVSRLVARAFISNPNKLPVVMHKDDDPSNNSKKNLKWGTYKDNSRDMVDKGRNVVWNKLIEEGQHSRICDLRAKGWKTSKIANKYGVGYKVVWNILKRYNNE